MVSSVVSLLGGIHRHTIAEEAENILLACIHHLATIGRDRRFLSLLIECLIKLTLVASLDPAGSPPVAVRPLFCFLPVLFLVTSFPLNLDCVFLGANS